MGEESVPLVGIGLIDLPKIVGARGTPGTLCSGIPATYARIMSNEVLKLTSNIEIVVEF